MPTLQMIWPSDPEYHVSWAFGRLQTQDFTVIDAQPPVPTSKDQSKKGGWRSYGIFQNQGDCVSFLATGGKTPPSGP